MAEYHICDYCQLGPFCDCGRIGGSDSTYYGLATRSTKNPYNNAATRLNEAIKKSQEETSCKEGITSWAEWIATGRTLSLATLRKIRSALFSRS